MKNFWFGLREFEENGCANVGIKVTHNNLEMKIPTCSKQNEFVEAFFAGTNVTAEEITTYGGFKYRATVNMKGPCSESDLKMVGNLLYTGFKELGYKVRCCTLNPIIPANNYEVTIKM